MVKFVLNWLRFTYFIEFTKSNKNCGELYRVLPSTLLSPRVSALRAMGWTETKIFHGETRPAGTCEPVGLDPNSSPCERLQVYRPNKYTPLCYKMQVKWG